MCAVRSYHLLIYWFLTLGTCILLGNGIYRFFGPESSVILRFCVGFAGGYLVAELSKRIFNWWRRMD